MKDRVFHYDVLTEIQERWSPRAFDRDKPVAQEDLMAMLEAASYAPSCYNEQPWVYVVGNDDEEHDKILGVLNEANQVWAKNAPVLLLILARKTFLRNQKENRWHAFDTGTAWGYLSLEAKKRGLDTHAMGGFSVEKAREVFQIPEDYSILVAVAVGYRAGKEVLPAGLQAMEFPSNRKLLEELIFHQE